MAITFYDTVYVDDNGPHGGNMFTSLADGVAATTPGGIVHIAAGTYDLSEPLYIDSPITLSGAGRDVVIIQAPQTGAVIYVDNVSFTMSGCTVRNGGTGVSLYYYGGSSENATLSGNAIYDNVAASTGVYFNVSGGASPVIELTGNSIHDNDGSGIGGEVYSAAVDLRTRSNAIYDNQTHGISLLGEFCTYLLDIAQNEIYGNGGPSPGSGISVQATGLNTFESFIDISENNIYENSGAGIDLTRTSGIFAPADGAVDLTVGLYDICQNAVCNNGSNGISISKLQMLIPAPVDGETIEAFTEGHIVGNVIDGNGFYGLKIFQQSSIFAPALDGGDDVAYCDYYIEKNAVTSNVNGGIFCEGTFFIELINNLVAGNKSVGLSGILLRSTIADIAHNTVADNNGGIYLDESYAFLYNNIVAANSGYGIYAYSLSDVGLDGDSMIYIANSDVWGNGCGGTGNYYGTADMTGVDGNISQDPLFAAPGDWHLLPESPCINTGSPIVGNVVMDDLDGTPRPLGSGFDMGCYESYVQQWSPVLLKPLVDTQLATVVQAWSCILAVLPEEIPESAHDALDAVILHVGNATSISNAIYAAGELSKALEAMRDIIDSMGIEGCI